MNGTGMVTMSGDGWRVPLSDELVWRLRTMRFGGEPCERVLAEVRDSLRGHELRLGEDLLERIAACADKKVSRAWLHLMVDLLAEIESALGM